MTHIRRTQTGHSLIFGLSTFALAGCSLLMPIRIDQGPAIGGKALVSSPIAARFTIDGLIRNACGNGESVRALTARSSNGQRETIQTAHYIGVECHSRDMWGFISQESHVLVVLVHINGAWKVTGIGPYGSSVGSESQVDGALDEGIGKLRASRVRDALSLIAKSRCDTMVEKTANYVQPFIWENRLGGNALDETPLTKTYRCTGLPRAEFPDSHQSDQPLVVEKSAISD